MKVKKQWAPDPGTKLLPGETRKQYEDRMENHILEILLTVDPKIGIRKEDLHLRVLARMCVDQAIAYGEA